MMGKVTRSTRRFQVRGPFGDQGKASRWTIVDTRDSNITVDTSYRKSDATEVAKELNELEQP